MRVFFYYFIIIICILLVVLYKYKLRRHKILYVVLSILTFVSAIVILCIPIWNIGSRYDDVNKILYIDDDNSKIVNIVENEEIAIVSVKDKDDYITKYMYLKSDGYYYYTFPFFEEHSIQMFSEDIKIERYSYKKSNYVFIEVYVSNDKSSNITVFDSFNEILPHYIVNYSLYEPKNETIIYYSLLEYNDYIIIGDRKYYI